MAEDRSRTEAEQLNKSPQERVRNRFSGVPRTLSELERQEERTEQELQHNENSSEVEVLLMFIKQGTTTLVAIAIYSNKGKRAGISKVGNKYYKKSSVPFLLSLIVLLVLAFIFFLLYINGE
ncbi:uncharacterized protein LOC110769998 isoform X2 [Prunus avium]|uniref:Uncharacterized protein LOC110769998 isoform X2 n=1 Tax=Prunus avium TaxID=42229 RepID=A0A6P5TS57_PRUAV|nr:uncharacterized protein LOC110769998 isoform X2 [Prunus avium]